MAGRNIWVPTKIVEIDIVTNPATGAYVVVDQVGAGLYKIAGLTKGMMPAGLVYAGYVDKGKNAGLTVAVILFADTFAMGADNDPFPGTDTEISANFQSYITLSSSNQVLANSNIFNTTTTPRPALAKNTLGDIYVGVAAAGAFSIAGANDLKLILGFQQMSGFINQ